MKEKKSPFYMDLCSNYILKTRTGQFNPTHKVV